MTPDLPRIDVTSRAMWRQWLLDNADTSAGVWAVTVKKAHAAAGDEWVSAQDLNEECLCVGWIDSKPGAVDDRRSALLCTPRKPGGGWSRVNKTRLERLLADGQVTARGLEVIEAAKADGSWSRLARSLRRLPAVGAARHLGVDPEREESRDAVGAHHEDGGIG